MFVKASEFCKQTVLCYFILQHRAELKNNTARFNVSITNFIDVEQMGGQRPVQSQIHFILCFFTIQVLYQSLKVECKANGLNRPDY